MEDLKLEKRMKTMKNNFKTYLCIILTGLFFLAGYNPVLAEQAGISIDQSIFAFDASPGESQNFTLNVKNIASSDQEVTFEASDYSIGNNNEISFTADANEVSGLKSWLDSSIPLLTLKSGEEREISFALKIPANATPGSHYGAVLAKARAQAQDNSSGPQISGRVAAHVLVNVKGELNGGGKIDYFYAPIFSGKIAEMSATFENTGNVHYIPHGEITVKNLITKKAQNSALDKHFVFPGKSYTFSVEEKIPSVLGIYSAEASFVDGEGKLYSARRYVMGKYFPVVVVIILIVLAFLFRFIIKTRKRMNPLPAIRPILDSRNDSKKRVRRIV
jgi:hypothetical protein